MPRAKEIFQRVSLGARAIGSTALSLYCANPRQVLWLPSLYVVLPLAPTCSAMNGRGADSNALGGSIHTVKENAEALVVATKEIGLEVNADKTKYMVMS